MSTQCRRLTIFLNEGQKLSFDIPKQREEITQQVNLFKDVWTSDKFAIEVDGTLFCIPWTSIKYIKLDPIRDGDVLPSPVLRGLEIPK